MTSPLSSAFRAGSRAVALWACMVVPAFNSASVVSDYTVDSLREIVLIGEEALTHKR
jgi:hypothetical protein